jgi:hypothetical protein
MPKSYTIQAGDSLANIAFEHGLFVDTVWQDPGNEGLRKLRPDMNILMSGDVLTIPDRRDHEVATATGKRHRFRLKGVPHVFQLQLFDDDWPRANQAYRLTVRGKDFEFELPGLTDAEGVLVAYIPPGVIAGRLSIDELDEQDQSALELDILFGSLDPIEELSGVQKRLVNLGFDCPVDGEVSDETTAAIEAFQRLFSLPVTGAVDNATRQKLTAMNESVSKYPDEPPDPE